MTRRISGTHAPCAVAVGFDPLAYSRYSSPGDWVPAMAQALVSVDHYYSVIPFGWASGSPSPDAIVQAGKDLFQRVQGLAKSIPDLQENDVIDVHLIGHSRGSVVVSEAIRSLINAAGAVPQMDHGYESLTLLDPHPANNLYGIDASISGFAALQERRGLSRVSGPRERSSRVHSRRVDEVDIAYEKTPTSAIALSTNAFPKAAS